MKSFLFLSLFTLFSTSSFANNGELNFKNFSCSGDAEYGEVIINKVEVIEKNVSITFTLNGVTSTQKYILTELKRNGVTDINKTAYFIGATKSGAKNDYEDMSLPHLGLYKTGMGSEIAFNIKGQRVFGTVSCK